MDKQAYQIACDLLATAGLRIDESRYAKEAFGSWHITVASRPRRRVVWDGKDGWLSIQQETNEEFAGNTVWRDLWIARDPAEQTPSHAVAELLRLSE